MARSAGLKRNPRPHGRFPGTGPALRLGLAATILLAAGCASRVTVRELPAPSLDPAGDLSEARARFDRIVSGRAGESDVKAYNEAVRRIVHHGTIEGDTLTVAGRTVPIEDRFEGLAAPSEPEAIRPADSLLIFGFRERVLVDGVGAPVVLRFPAEGYSSDEGRFQPATALLEFDGAGDLPRLVLHDPLAHTSARVGDSPPLPLRSDFTAPLASRFAAEDLQRINVPAMLSFDRFDGDLGMSQIDATYPGKIPLVFVHGLKATPITWRDVMNELRADPEVREKYEFWTFGYGTGAPIPFSAMKLREALRGMATFRELLGARTDDVVLVGHSMGGLLSRLMTERSGDEVWFKFVRVPLDELPLPEEDREILRRMAYFEPLPFVRRVTFVATPHGGSRIADDLIGQVFSGLIQLPTQLLRLSGSMVRAPFSLLTPEGEKVVARIPTSISQLASQSELLQELRARPLNPAVTFHSIMGDRGLGDALGESSDGVVPYDSAHLDGVASEKVVPSGHKAHLHPEAVEELRRILREHAGAP